MSTRNVMTKQTALAKARERRRQLDRERGEQDERIETATAATLLALEGRAVAERALKAAQHEVGGLVRTMLAEDVSVERAAALLDLEVADVRRLLKIAPSRPAGERSGAAKSPTTVGGASS